MDLWLDLETRSRLNLPLVGVHVYATAAEIVLNAWAIDGGPVRVDESCTPAFWDAFCKADRILAHNAEFDRTVLQACHPGIDIRADRWYCTMAQARRHGLPGGLGALCDIMNVPTDKAKLKNIRSLLMMFCKPNKEGTFNTKKTHPAEWAKFISYAGLDVDAMREVHKRCPKWNDEYEQAIWQADQIINARGFLVDTQFAKAAVDALEKCSETTDQAVEVVTGGSVGSGRQVKALLAHILAEHGVDLPDMQAATIERRLKDPDLPDEVHQLLALRQQSSKTSTSKYATLLRCVNSDNRMRGTLSYSGAMRTQRWAGNRFQPHNLPRPTMPQTEIAAGIRAVKAGVYDLVGTHPLPDLLASAVRGCVVAPRGKTLTVGDYSNIEGRVLAWLAGEEWQLQAYRDFDAGSGPDLYKLAYSRAFGVPVDEVTSKQRQVGKVMELMLGYGGGVGAFVTGAATYRVDLNELVETAWPLVPARIQGETKGMWDWAVERKRTYGLTEEVFRVCDALKRIWREQHPKIVEFWADLEDAFVNAVAGHHQTVGMLTVDKVGAWVRIKGPQGSYISYPGAKVEGEKLTYKGQNQYTRTWSTIDTYGGKLSENVTQWVSRCLLAEAIVYTEEWEADVVLHVHDELVAEDIDEAGLAFVMKNAAKWAGGLPLAVATYSTDRYHKE